MNRDTLDDTLGKIYVVDVSLQARGRCRPRRAHHFRVADSRGVGVAWQRLGFFRHRRISSGHPNNVPTVETLEVYDGTPLALTSAADVFNPVGVYRQASEAVNVTRSQNNIHYP